MNNQDKFDQNRSSIIAAATNSGRPTVERLANMSPAERKSWAEAEYNSNPAVRQDFPSAESYGLYVNAVAKGLVKITGMRQGEYI